MTVPFALEYIKSMMCHAEYEINFRHLIMQPLEVRKIGASDHIYLLIEPPADLRVESDFGLFDYCETIVNELQYEHRGSITVTNHSLFVNHLKAIQVIPRTPVKKCD